MRPGFVVVERPGFDRGLESAELEGEPTYLVTNFVGGIKNLPIRCKLRAATATAA